MNHYLQQQIPVEKNILPETPVTIRRAMPADLGGIARLVQEQARLGALLPRSPESIATDLDNWLVAELADQVVGCVSLLAYSSGLVEVRSLAVHQAARGRGTGRLLVEALIVEARRRQIPTLFALTRVVPFFQRCGFTVSDKTLFPEKVWIDCHKCPIRHHCDETAVILNLDDYTEIHKDLAEIHREK